MKILSLYLLVFGLLLLNGCQKEVSFENGGASDGSLQSDVTGDCLPKTVNGTYTAATPLVLGSNTITAQVNVTKAGLYTVYTDTVNGYYFRGTGVFTTLGSATVVLGGNGTPFAAGTNNFVVHYASTICDLAVTVLPAGSGTTPAVFTLQGSPGSCSAAVIAGAYGVGSPLNAANTVTISVAVTTVGTYNITTTPTGGITFTGTGTFSSTGVQTVVLTGSGTPTTAGANVIPITAGSTNCSFTVTVGTAGAGTLGGAGGACTSSLVNGTYTVGTPLAVSNTVTINVNVTTLGAYSISTNSVTGFSFSGSGTFGTVGPAQQITLTGTGTPTAAGPQTFTVTYGGGSCTFVVTVVGAPLSDDYFPRTANSNWSYEYDDDPNDTLLIKAIAPTLSALGNTYNIFMGTDDASAGFDSAGYYRRSGGDYFNYFNASDATGFDNTFWTEYSMLKDNVTAGTPWNSGTFSGSISGTPIQERFKFTLQQKNASVSVTTSLGTANYVNVDVVEQHFEVFVGGTWQDLSALGSAVSYYAKGIGLIKVVYTDNSGGNFTQELRRYEVF